MRPFASNEMVIKARQMHLQGIGVSEIARALGFNEKNIYGLTARRQIYRWIAPLPDSSASYLIKTLAEQGKSKREARRIVGLGKTRFNRLVDGNTQISWKLKTEKPAHEKIEDQLIDLADLGLSMRQASIVLGVNREKVRLIASGMPNNPWGPREIASAWLHKTGETVAQTARRLADTHTLIQVATLIGYGDGRALRKALIARNVHVKFVVDPRNEARWHRKSA